MISVPHNKRHDITKNVLWELYVEKHLSIHQIAQQLNYARSGVSASLKKYGIPLRDVSEACKLRSHPGPMRRRTRVYKDGAIINQYVRLVKELPLTEKYGKKGRRRFEYQCLMCGRTKVSYYYPTAITRLRCCKKHPGFGEISGDWWLRQIRGAKARGLEFNVTIDYCWGLFIQQNRMSAFSGQPLWFYKNRRKETQNASLDRIDSAKGYIEGNLQWVTKLENRMKGNMSDTAFRHQCHMVALYPGQL